MTASVNDFFKKTATSTVTTLSAPGKAIGATSINVGSTTNYPIDTGVIVSIRTVDTSGNLIAGTHTEWSAIVTSGTSLSIAATPVYGSDQIYAAGSTTQVAIRLSSYAHNKLIDGLLVQHTQTGAHHDITSTNATITNATIANLTIGSQAPSADWTAVATTPNTVTYNGQRSYSMVFNGVDYTNILSPGQRLKTTRTVAAPTQCTSLNGTTQYWVKTSPNKLTFTNNFVIDVYIKLTSYTAGVIVSRYNGTSGWVLQVAATGQLYLYGFNGGASNILGLNSYQSVPLNKWVRVTAQMDMTVTTNTTTTNYIMIDGVDVPALAVRGGTNPTSLVQAGNLEIGSMNGGTQPFPGKIAQVAIYNAKVAQADIRATHSQGLSGSETSLASAYSFNGVATDLNTTTPNDLTAQASAGYAADSPFGTQASGLISSTLDYGIVQSATFSTNTTVVVQVPEGCTIPTSGGLSAVAYSGLKIPYGFPSDRKKWTLNSLLRTSNVTTSNATYGSYLSGGWTLNVPAGAFDVGWNAGLAYNNTTTTVIFNISNTALTGMTSVTGNNASPFARSITSPSAAALVISMYTKQSVLNANSSTYVMYSIGATPSAGIDGGGALAEIFAENTLL